MGQKSKLPDHAWARSEGLNDSLELGVLGEDRGDARERPERLALPGRRDLGGVFPEHIEDVGLS